MTEPDIVRVIDDLKHCDGRHRNIGVYTFKNAIEAIEQLRKERDQSIRERDEARRWFCDMHHTGNGANARSGSRKTAEAIGWDCFKEENP
jgi:hypothetical protein